MDTEGSVWRATEELLAEREHPKWKSLSWIALRPLISSINDRVNWLAPRLVDELRRAWVAGDPQGAGNDGVVDRSGTDCFIVMGDTGEQDASQYVLVPALEQELERDADFLLICSDVIYPSGDINDYTHGFYLPYRNLLRARPDRAQRVYGLPGNHDWYDGLTGFMNTFCGEARLDDAAYAWPRTWPETGWRKTLRAEGFGRVLWRRPSHARPTRVDRSEPHVGVDDLRNELTGPLDLLTRQPGPYFAIRVKGLLLVCIDGGIGTHGDCEIDPAQADWLVGLKSIRLPKVLLTGYPLLVNDEWKYTRVAGRPGRTVNEIVVDPEQNYVAAIGGDIHNFQHYRLAVGEEPRELTYIVAGGGGAYLSATHPVPGATRQAVDALESERPGLSDEVRAANARIGGPTGPDRRLAAAPVVDPGGPPGMIPTPEESLSRFTEVILPRTWRFLRALIASSLGVAGAFAVAWLVPGFEPGEGRGVGPSDATLWALGIAVALGFGGRIFKLLDLFHVRAQSPRLDRAALVVLATLTGALLPVAAARIGPQNWRSYFGLWVALGLTSVVLGLAQRRSGWWRQPGRDDEPWPVALLSLGVMLLSVGLLLQAGLIERLWLVAVAVLLVVGLAVTGYVVRRIRRTRRWWRSNSLVVAPAVELVAAGLVLAAVPGEQAALRPLEVVLGLALFAVLLLLALGLTCLVLALPPGAGGPRLRLGRRGIAAPALIAGFVLVLSALAIWNAQVTGGPFWRGVVVTTCAAGLLVLGVFGVDAVRRFYPGAYRYIATGVGIAAAVVIGLLPLDDHWLAAGLVVSAAAAVLVAGVVMAGYLAFLGGHNLIFDRDAHLDRSERPGQELLIGPLDAKLVIEWRQGMASAPLGRDDSAHDRRLRRRAKFVTPSTDKPQGLIQEKVSEFFSSDVPPFVQHYLKMRVLDMPSGPQLEITPHVVTGEDDVPSRPRGVIRIPLPQEPPR